MYRLVRENLKGGKDYVHSIVYGGLGDVRVPDVRARQAGKILKAYEYRDSWSDTPDSPHGRTELPVGEIHR